jgi:hypothetical protein
VQDALAAPLRDPMHALTQIVGQQHEQTISLSVPSSTNNLLALAEHPGPVPHDMVRRILRQRHFRMLTPHTILKSFHQPDAYARRATREHQARLDGVSDLRHLAKLPIWLVSNPSVQVLLPSTHAPMP